MKSTGSALAQAKSVAHNILASPFSQSRIDDPEEQEAFEALVKKGEVYDYYFGYTSNPIHTSKKKLLLAESDYQHDTAETFLFDQAKPGRLMKTFASFFPRLYWKHSIKGKWWALGTHHIRAAQLADSPWKYTVTRYHKSEKKPD